MRICSGQSFQLPRWVYCETRKRRGGKKNIFIPSVCILESGGQTFAVILPTTVMSVKEGILSEHSAQKSCVLAMDNSERLLRLSKQIAMSIRATMIVQLCA